MPLKALSDLHGATEALEREVSSEDVLLLLGDLVNIIDYRRMDGLLVDIFGMESVEQVVALRTAGKVEEAREVIAQRREGRESEIGQRWMSSMSEAYRRVKQALTASRTLLIGGNVDPPWALDLMAEDPRVELVDGQVHEIGGVRVGFVGGGIPTPMGVAGEVTAEEFARKLDSLGEVDVICTHVPPDVAELTYDVIMEQRVPGSAELLTYIEQRRPSMALFGHIHQPLLSSMYIGVTHAINCGYFRSTHRALRLPFDDWRE